MRVLSLTFLILSCYIGTGFASGREIVEYFTRYGLVSIVFSFIMCLVLFFLTRFFLEIKHSESKNIEIFSVEKYNDWLQILLYLCTLILCSSMVAGGGSLANYMQMNPLVFTFITIVIVFIILLKRIKIFEKINRVLTPIVVVFLLVFSIILVLKVFNCEIKMHQKTSKNTILSLISSAMYLSYNLTLSSAFMSEIGVHYTKNEIKQASFLSIFLLFIILLFYNFSFLKLDFNILNDDMPLIFLAFKFNKNFGFFVCFIVWIALLTTLITCVYSLTKMLNLYIKNYKLCLFLNLFLSFLISLIGFVNIVKYLYFFIGTIGLFYICLLIYCTKKGVKI